MHCKENNENYNWECVKIYHEEFSSRVFIKVFLGNLGKRNKHWEEFVSEPCEYKIIKEATEYKKENQYHVNSGNQVKSTEYVLEYEKLHNQVKSCIEKNCCVWNKMKMYTPSSLWFFE